MSTNRDYLQVFKSIIDKFTYDPNVRIIISVRIFDLYYDPSLRVYKNLKTIKVGILDEEIVIEQLAKIGIHKNKIPAKLLFLLRTPYHLNIFSRIAASIAPKYSIINLQGLYRELYSQKILSIPDYLPVKAQKVKKLLFKIVDKMHSSQSITVSQHYFENYTKELNYMESERLIKKEGVMLQFFHQTFYDYVFAKRFVEKGENLVHYIKRQEQSILIRFAVKMILSYLREYDNDIYIGLLKELFSNDEILFHIKHMAFSYIILQEKPSLDEAAVISSVLVDEENYLSLFFENATSKIWFDMALRINLK